MRAHLIVYPIAVEGRRVAMVRYGWVRCRPVHAATCALCWWGVYDQAEFALAAKQMRWHLTDSHGIPHSTLTCTSER
jgi:hypothetical protein